MEDPHPSARDAQPLRIMPNYRRGQALGATWFFTVNLLRRRANDLLVRDIGTLRECVALEQAARPFVILGWVVLPDHMHWLWRLPEGDADYPTRWRRIKTAFALRQPKTEARSDQRIARGERGIWQRRYWEHQIRDERDYARHLDYIHYNPVKHGWAARAADWPHSSFRHHVARGVYDENWADGTGISIVGDDV